MSSLHIRNPHSILAALEKRPHDVTQIFLPKDPSDAWERVASAAKKKGVKTSLGAPSASRPGKMAAREEEGGRVGAGEAVIQAREPLSPEELFRNAKGRADGNGLWIALDSLQDPHNVGAIFRAAAFFGVEGILLTQERSAPLSAVVYDVASGGMETVPFTLQINLQRGFEVAKDAGLWILGASEHAHDPLDKIQKDRPWLLVLGNEENGMRRLTEEACDLLCKIPSHPSAGVTSLNVSVAAGVLMARLA